MKEICPDDSVLKIGMVWPLPDDVIREFADRRGASSTWSRSSIPSSRITSAASGYHAIGKDIIPICGELTPEIVDRR